jgi:hypothetical protein
VTFILKDLQRPFERLNDLPLKFETTLDGRVLLFTAAVSLLSTLLFGLLPALRTTRLDLVPALKAGDVASSPTEIPEVFQRKLIGWK